MAYGLQRGGCLLIRGGCSIHWCKSRTDFPSSSAALASEITFSARAREQRRSNREGRSASIRCGSRYGGLRQRNLDMSRNNRL